jgi:hypothetical protein
LALLNLGGQIIVDGAFGLGPFIRLGLLAPVNQPCLMDVGVVWGKEAGTGRVIGAAPVFP